MFSTPSLWPGVPPGRLAAKGPWSVLSSPGPASEGQPEEGPTLQTWKQAQGGPAVASALTRVVPPGFHKGHRPGSHLWGYVSSFSQAAPDPRVCRMRERRRGAALGGPPPPSPAPQLRACGFPQPRLPSASRHLPAVQQVLSGFHTWPQPP